MLKDKKIMDLRSIPRLPDDTSVIAKKKAEEAVYKEELKGLVHVIWLIGRYYASKGMLWEDFSDYWEVETFPKKYIRKIKQTYKAFYDKSKQYTGEPLAPEELTGVIDNSKRDTEKKKKLAGRVAELEVVIDAYVKAGAKEKMWATVEKEYGIKDLPLSSQERLSDRYQRRIEEKYMAY